MTGFVDRITAGLRGDVSRPEDGERSTTTLRHVETFPLYDVRLDYHSGDTEVVQAHECRLEGGTLHIRPTGDYYIALDLTATLGVYNDDIDGKETLPLSDLAKSPKKRRVGETNVEGEMTYYDDSGDLVDDESGIVDVSTTRYGWEGDWVTIE